MLESSGIGSKKHPRPSHVLVVDDEDDMCWALRHIIETHGHRCSVAKTAHEAIEALGQKQFDLAFVDVRLPDMDGFELVRRIRSETDHLPCVLVSGFLYEDDDLVRDGLASHLIAGFIGKPFLLSQIHQTLESVVAQSPTDREDATLSNPGAIGEGGNTAVSGKRIPSDGIAIPPQPSSAASCMDAANETKTHKPKASQDLGTVADNLVKRLA